MDKTRVFCELRTENLCTVTGNHSLSKTFSLSRLVASLSLQRLGFDPVSDQVRFMEDRVTAVQAVLRILHFLTQL